MVYRNSDDEHVQWVWVLLYLWMTAGLVALCAGVVTLYRMIWGW